MGLPDLIAGLFGDARFRRGKRKLEGAVRTGFDPNVWSGRASQQDFVELAAAAFGEYVSSATAEHGRTIPLADMSQ
jgi:hypothetical protein